TTASKGIRWGCDGSEVLSMVRSASSGLRRLRRLEAAQIAVQAQRQRRPQHDAHHNSNRLDKAQMRGESAGQQIANIAAQAEQAHKHDEVGAAGNRAQKAQDIAANSWGRAQRRQNSLDTDRQHQQRLRVGYPMKNL